MSGRPRALLQLALLGGQADLEMCDRKSRPSSSSSTLRGAPVLALSTSFVRFTWASHKLCFRHRHGVADTPLRVKPPQCPVTRKA